MYDKYVCRNCGFILYTDLLPFKYLSKKCPKCNNEEFEAIVNGKNKISQSKGLGNSLCIHGTRNDKGEKPVKPKAVQTEKIHIDRVWLDQFSTNELVDYSFFFELVVGKRFFDDYYLQRTER